MATETRVIVAGSRYGLHVVLGCRSAWGRRLRVSHGFRQKYGGGESRAQKQVLKHNPCYAQNGPPPDFYLTESHVYSAMGVLLVN